MMAETAEPVRKMTAEELLVEEFSDRNLHFQDRRP
jgi:hypothetical protein